VTRCGRTGLGLVAAIVAVALCGCANTAKSTSPASSSLGTQTAAASAPPESSTVSASSGPSTSGATTAPIGDLPAGFNLPLATMTITASDGGLIQHRVWLADTAERQARGLMEVTEIPGARSGVVGMAFVFAQPTESSFYMLKTRLPLTIAFVSEGRVAALVDMEPCPNDDDDPRCPRYGSPVPYDLAIEVDKGVAASLGLEPGAPVDVS
jgi:uncharacterized membrane protein (UPF0127 family)